MRRAVVIFIILLGLCGPVVAQEFRALARMLPESSRLDDTRQGAELILALSQAVPYRIFTLTAPNRLVMDFREVSFEGVPDAVFVANAVFGARTGAAAPGWSRLVLDLAEPLRVAQAGMQTDPNDGSALITVLLHETSAEQFAALAGAPPGVDVDFLTGSAQASGARLRQTGEDILMVVLDPGHGGVDPGAQNDGANEADLVLVFARELREVLLRTGEFNVVLTRDSDVFVPLPTRVSIARAAQADLFISLHADALAVGRATGATVYTLSDTASDAASQALAERHNRTDLLSGIDLSDSDDEIAGVLMDLARLETDPRSDALADAMVAGIAAANGVLHSTPRLEAGFAVLKAADIPSVLVELGFMSDQRDLRNLLDAVWRARLQEGMVDALRDWAIADAAEGQLLRQ
jgi:N-acetylmuramoyl-L-alanine amidase